MWKPLLAEVREDQDIRSKKVLDDVFGSDDSTYVSVTSHSGEIASLLRGICSCFPLFKSRSRCHILGVLLGFSLKFARGADNRIVLNHRVFSLGTGQVIPVLVKAETIASGAPATTTLPWSAISTCSSPAASTTTA